MGKNKRNESRRNVANKSKQLIKDFEKKKRKKLGVKLKPANATEISFRSHSIHVSKQSLKDQNRELRTSLALLSADISEALIGLSSHKPKVRRDVLIELKSILSRIEDSPKKFKNVLHQNLVSIVSIFEMVYDHEELVRNALKTFVNWFMPRCKEYIQLFGPFWSTILAHLSAALSHINTKIRYNALKILRSFFSVSSVANYFSMKWCLSLLSHLELLFFDIIRSGHFILNDDDIRMVTSLSKRSDVNGDNKVSQNTNTQKVARTSSNHQKTQIIVHILCECSTHIIRVIQKQMHNSYDTIENNLHSLLLPNERKTNDNNGMELDNEWTELMNDSNMCLLKSLLSIFVSCALIFEQFGKKHKYSAMSMVLTLLCIISDCLCDNALKGTMDTYLKYKQKMKQNKQKNKHKKQRKMKVNDLRVFVSKGLMSLFNVFPIEFIEKTEMESESMDTDDIKMENETETEIKSNKQEMDRMYVMRMNMKVIRMCSLFMEYWQLNLGQKLQRNKKRDYFKISYTWLHGSLKGIGANKEGINSKVVIDLLMILKELIPFYDEKKQFQLLLAIDKVMKNSAFVNEVKTMFGHVMN